ncbi:hypothetical protein [Agrobacterium tumefaciens]|uniref:hypothetical protein n=1 Tax=Agrobacterium tumefaciens TaxID=358 RepID=UPI0021D30C6B|nr:hypothetical protein [Agrobacterium tumefaciens]UXS08690.1 hypothetical protein FY155_03365 [Agrobacterium tumefaciens]UXS16051.1 hypothetical protein FY154_03360 [Agrobacterium tumefaciens]
MFSAFIKTLLILTSLTPICLVYAWVAINEGYAWVPFWLLIASAFLGVACWFVLTKLTNNLEKFELRFSSVEPVDQENISFLLLYLSPLFLDKVSSVNLNILVPTLGLYAFLLATSYTYHFNPLLSLMGWHFFKVGTPEGVSYVLLTRKKIKNVDSIKNVGQLTGYMLIDLSE